LPPYISGAIGDSGAGNAGCRAIGGLLTEAACLGVRKDMATMDPFHATDVPLVECGDARRLHATVTGRCFASAWEAQVFALALLLQQRGVCTSSEWAKALDEEIKRAQAAGDPDTGETYYHHWLSALERVVAAKGLTTAAVLKSYHDAWDRAADRTPHGKPIALRLEDFVAGLPEPD